MTSFRNINNSFCNTVMRTLLLVFALAGAFIAHAQSPQPVSPDRGAKLGNSYAIGDFETINTTNGNLMLNFPLGGLPAGRGSATAGVYLTYNSKLYNMRSEKRPDYRYFDAYYNRTVIEPDLYKGGWKLGGGYSLEFETRFGNYEPNCTVGASELNDQIVHSNKLRVVFPDGSSHEMIPYGHKDKLGDRYFNITMNGMIRSCTALPTYTARPVYYSRDGSYLRLESTSQSEWVLYFPDGSKVVNGSRVYDRNGNYADAGYGASDQFGRTVTVSWDNGYQLVTSKGFGGEELVWKIRWKTIAVIKTYRACPPDLSCPGDDFPLPNRRDYLTAGFEVVDKIIQPQQLGGGAYTFTYNGIDTPPVPTTLTYGWGEISGIEMPNGAKVSYEYLMDGEDGPIIFESTNEILKNHVTTKILKYDLEYDGQVIDDGGVETWGYGISSEGSWVTGPDGSVSQTGYGTTQPDSSGYLPWNSGLTLTTYSPDGTKVENLWERNIPTACTQSSTCASYFFNEHADNPYIKTSFTSIRDSSGSYTLTAIRDFTYDKNGNVTETREYDFVPYLTVPRTDGRPTGLPSNASDYLKRINKTEFYNPTPEASTADYNDADIYVFSSSKRLLRLAKSSEVQDGSQTPKSRSEINYDFTNYDSSNTVAGNPTLTRAWDSAKGSVTNPLISGNSVTTSATYNAYGMPLTTTDAKGVVNAVTYGNITTPTGIVWDLYPTQTETASNYPSLKRTSTAAYDFHTGLVTSATDVDNNVTSGTEYDALGRPVKSITAQGTPLEVWTQTEYNDINRRVIVRSDLFTKGDGKKVATQFYDQIGRVRLSKTLEDATQSATNETDGIKVQTRYQTGNPNSYQLTSNPFRAATATAATNEPSMGWTRSKSWNTGKKQQIETLSGAALPAPWGSNSNSTGVVTTDIDADRTLVTDQAGKQRISRTNALGQLKDIWEVTASDAATEAISFPNQTLSAGYRTSYNYDTLNNLTTVSQGVQTRSFSYNSLSRLLSATNPESGSISYLYDPNGNLTRKTDARSIQTNFTYDALNRVTLRDYSDTTPDVTYLYDNLPNAKGKLTKVASSVSTTEYMGFDILGRVTAHKQTTDGTAYTTAYIYNLSGALVEETYPSGRVVKNVLDNEGDLEIVKSKKNAISGYFNYAKNFTYTAAGAVSSMQLGNGKWESTVFNSRLQPTQIALGTVQNGTDKLKLDYSYGTTTNNGNVQSQTINVPTVGSNQGFTAVQNYTYDSLNRLKSATENIGVQTWKQSFLYDRYGNRNFDTANTTTLGSCPQAQCNPAIDPANNRFTTGQGYTFDLSGNVITDAEGRSFNYDAENKQNSATNTSGTIGTYFYDGDGKRVKKVVPNGETTIFVYDASSKIIAEYSTVVAAPTEAKVSYLTSDNLGSPRINTDANGNVIARHDYHPFGEEIVGTGRRTTGLGYTADDVRKKFTSYERDNEIELDFAQARYYNSKHGRFISVDPALESMKAAIPQSWNRYTYVLNNPLLYIDPDGELWVRNTSDGNAKDQPYIWVDKCGEGQTCYEAIAHDSRSGVRVYGSNDANDITDYAANKNGVIDVRALSQHHNAEFVVADGQNVPEEYLTTNASTALFNVAKYYSEQYSGDDKLVFTAGAASDGKPGICGGKPCHSGHQGNDIDLRYMDSRGKPIQGDSAYQSADIGRTNLLVAVFRDNGRPVSYTGDDSRFGRPDDTPKYRDPTEKVHRHHLHVGIAKPKRK